MSDTKVIFGNTLIAEFMGVSTSKMAYHISLDWLMPVVEKIRGMGYNFSIVSGEFDWSVYILGDDGSLNFPYYSKLIDAIYTCVIQFITWHKTQTP